MNNKIRNIVHSRWFVQQKNRAVSIGLLLLVLMSFFSSIENLQGVSRIHLSKYELSSSKQSHQMFNASSNIILEDEDDTHDEDSISNIDIYYNSISLFIDDICNIQPNLILDLVFDIKNIPFFILFHSWKSYLA